MAQRRVRRGVLNEYLLNGKCEGYIYVGFLDKKDDIYKIGRSVDPFKRLIGLKREHGNNFKFYTFSKKLWNYAVAEQTLHNSLCEPICNNKYKGDEWFYLGNMDIERLLSDMERLEIASDEMYEFE